MQSAELEERLRAVETAVTAHVSECAIRNQEASEWRKKISDDVDSLRLEKAKIAGYLMGIAAAGSVVGAGGVQAIVHFFGG